MKKLIKFFIEENKFTMILMAFFVIFGLRGLFKLNSESFPAVNLGTAIITTIYPGAGPKEVEEEVTKPIEDEIRTVRGLKDVRSVSQSGLSKFTVRVDIDNYDVKEVMDDLQKAVQRVADLPPDILEMPRFQEIKSEEFPAIELAVVGPNDNRQRDRFAEFLKDRLEDNKKVLGVSYSGFREREFIVGLYKEKLDFYYLGISEITRVLRNRNKNIPAGNLKKKDETLLVKLDGKVSDIKGLEDIYVRSNFSGKNTQLKDIAEVHDGMEDPTVIARLDGAPATLLIVTKKSGEDTIQLVDEIEEQLKTIKIPEGFKISVYANEAKKVKRRMEILSTNAFFGLILVVVFLLIFLPGKVGIMAAISLPLSVLATLGLMPSMDMNINTITVLALVISLGMMVDNSVVIAEYFTRLRQDGMDLKDAAITSAYKFWLPITCTALTTIAGFLPMLVTKGTMGQFIRYIPIIVTLALSISLFESFFMLPARLVFIGKLSKKEKEEAQTVHWFDKVTAKFEKLMDVLIHKRYWVSLGFFLIIVGSLFMLIFVNKFVLFPADQTELYISRFATQGSSSVEATDRAAAKLSRAVKKVLGDDAEFIVARSGVINIGPGDPKNKDGYNVGMLSIHMTKEASFSLSYIEVLKKLRAIKTPYLSKVSFEAKVNGPPVGSAVSATFRSSNLAQLDGLVGELYQALDSKEGILTPEIDDEIGEDEVLIKLNYEKIARSGLDVNLVGNAIKTAIEGSIVTKINLDDKKFNIKVQLANPDRKFVKDLQKLKILNKTDYLIPLAGLAKLERTGGSAKIKRFDFLRAKNISADIDEELITSGEANSFLLKKFDELQKKYPEVAITFGGEEESTRESMSSLAEAMGLAIIAIFGILVFLFKSYLRPFVIMSTIPLGLLGFSVAFFLHGRPVSFLSVIGIIGLAGIIVNSGIVLISFIDEMRKIDHHSLHEILVKASSLRLRAVIVTSLTTISGLLPTAYGLGGLDQMLIPITLAMAWGLTSGTILTLIWVPCAYAIIEDLDDFFKRKKS
ncbi:MAG: efflux RND transporter permease subunit [Deltaproteobacteria bacterium]|nr:MAG: efflux RND transporter permease subunit [Deltaproteobacteria bacterium]